MGISSSAIQFTSEEAMHAMMQDIRISAEEQARASLSSTKQLYSDIKKAHEARQLPDEDELIQWRKTVSSANKTISFLLRTLNAQREQFRVETAVIMEEVRGELVDREANAARTAERYRLFVDRECGHGGGVDAGSKNAYDRALSSARQIEASLFGLGATATLAGPGCKALSDESFRDV